MRSRRHLEETVPERHQEALTLTWHVHLAAGHEAGTGAGLAGPGS